MSELMHAVSVIGLGKLGAPMAAFLAARGHTVVGVDLNEALVEMMAEGRAPFQEPELQEYLDKGTERLTVTTDVRHAVLNTDTTFVVVATPSDPSGRFSNDYVLGAVEQIGAALRDKDGYHVVNVTSTVMPGSCQGPITETLEHSSGRRAGETVGLCYNPEFIALGSVLRDMARPDFVLLGESDERAGAVVADIYRKSCDDNPPVRRMNLINAELAKISVNTFVTTKISYANMLADVCERFPGADVDVVTHAVGSDSRIGTKYLRGALGYGGPCFPRDNIAFAQMAQEVGARADLALATDSINRHQVERLAAIVEQAVVPGATVGILGLTYKPDTDVIDESQPIQLAHMLAEAGYRVVVHDPLALANAMTVLDGAATAAPTIDECLRQADFVVIATAWPQFRDLPLDALRRPAGKLSILDCWRLLPRSVYSEAAELIYLGQQPNLPAASD